MRKIPPPLPKQTSAKSSDPRGPPEVPNFPPGPKVIKSVVPNIGVLVISPEEMEKVPKRSFELGHKLMAILVYDHLLLCGVGRVAAKYATARRFGTNFKRISEWVDPHVSRSQRLQLLDRSKKLRRTGEHASALKELRNKLKYVGPLRLRKLYGPPTGKWPQQEAKLHEWFLQQRAVGKKVLAYGLTLKFRFLLQESGVSGEDGKPLSPGAGWLAGFVCRWGLSWRRKTNSKGHTIHDKLPGIRAWYYRFMCRLQRPDRFALVDTKYGRWPLRFRYNVDQVPLSIMFNMSYTWDKKGSKFVPISQAKGAHKESRDCTLQVCICLDPVNGLHVKIAIIFRGTGQRISYAERMSWDPRVDVYFQPKAWADRPFSEEWVDRTLRTHVEAHHRHPNPDIGGYISSLLLADNLDSHKTPQFRDSLRSLQTVLQLFVTDVTEKTQAIDRGVGKAIKDLVCRARDKLMEADEDNFDLWCHSLTASQRRILITQWVGEAWQKFCRDYHNIVTRCAEKSGNALGVDFHNAEKISFEGYDEPVKFSEADCGGLGVSTEASDDERGGGIDEEDEDIPDELLEGQIGGAVVDPEDPPAAAGPCDEERNGAGGPSDIFPDVAEALDLPVLNPEPAAFSLPHGYEVSEIELSESELIGKTVLIRYTTRRYLDWFRATVSSVFTGSDPATRATAEHGSRAAGHATHNLTLQGTLPRGLVASKGRTQYALTPETRGSEWFVLEQAPERC